MARMRRNSQFETLNEVAAFKVTTEQLDWLRAASIKAGDVSLSEWLRKLATASGEKLLEAPFPGRKLLPPKKRPK
jgi:hypothetical protein